MRSRPVFAAALGLLLISLLYISLQGLQTLFTPLEQHILTSIRLPKLLAAIIVGGSLSLASASLQVQLNNPLVEPGILGISSGASLAAAVAIVLLPNSLLLQWSLPVICSVGALLSLGCFLYVAAKAKFQIATLILLGVGLSTLFAAVMGWIFWQATPGTLKDLSFWLMGSLGYVQWPGVWVTWLINGVLCAWLLSRSQWFNASYFGETELVLKGVDLAGFRRNHLAVVGVITGVATALVGTIAFIGLIVPHAIRLCFGYDNRKVFPLSFLLGGALLGLVLLVSEAWFISSPPVSMITALIGGPMLMFFLLRRLRLMSGTGGNL